MLENLQNYADQLVRDHAIPAVSIAVWKDGKLYEAASGVLNLDTGVEATTDSIFQIGSISKVFTASLIMKLVDDGRIELDKPVKHYLRSFQIADKQATETITVKQLLNHTSGIAGDYFSDDQREDGPHIARYVDRCSQLPLMHPVGEGYSYSNAAFAIAGRLIEVCLGMSWFDAIEEHIFQPLGMSNAICRPGDVLGFRAATGHLEDSADPKKLRTCSDYLTLGAAPAGTTTTMTAADLVTFGRAHLDKGVSQSGERWLTEESIRLMQTGTVDIPLWNRVTTSTMGLGWMLDQNKLTGLKSFGHSGGTNGQFAHLQIFPEQKTCFALLANKLVDADVAYFDIPVHLAELATDIKLKPDYKAPEVSLDKETLQSYVGFYRSYALACEINLDSGGLIYVFGDTDEDRQNQPKITLSPIGDECFKMSVFDETCIQFLKPDKQGRPLCLSIGGRLFNRVERLNW